MEYREAIDLDFPKIWLGINGVGTCSRRIYWCCGDRRAFLLAEASLSSGGKLLLKKIDQTSALTGLGEQIGQLNGVRTEKSNPLKTEAEVVGSTPLAEKTITALKLKDTNGELLEPETLANQVKVKEILETDVLQRMALS
jgi:uncharacterized protein involved in exopolysaccharide biosynthesis